MLLEQLLVYRISQLVLLVGPMTAYVVSPSANYDAISLPKMLSISSFGYLILALVLSRWPILSQRISKPLFFSSVAFMSFMFLTLLFSGAPISQQIWGSFGRNTGFVTYSSLLFILLGAALIKEEFFYVKLVRVFVFSSIPIFIYCLVQMAGKDPIRWSEMRTFATFGNVNFLSAYLGMVGISCLALILGERNSITLRATSLLLLTASMPIILSTNSIQGIMVLLAGAFVLIGFKVRSFVKTNFWLIPYCLTGITLLLSILFALFNRGPLAPLIFQTSIVLRGDYMHAGLEMTQRKPLFGVGLDSYGDWYREVRGEITTNRGSADRIANSAHNIFLDISSNGGVPLLAAYIAFILLALIGSLKIIKRYKEFNPFFAAIFATWIGYQIQSLISINQIAVGVWGWIFTGALIGYSAAIISRDQTKPLDGSSISKSKISRSLQSKSANRVLRTKLLPPQVTLIGIVGFALGATLSLVPLTADVAYKKASQTLAIDQMFDATKRMGSTAFHRELVLEAATKSNLTAQAGEIALSLVTDYPRDFYAWKILALISPPGSPDRSRAVDVLISLDPFNRQSIPSR
jgi:O-antigen ligase